MHLEDRVSRGEDTGEMIDNEGEDYLYPAGYFVFIELPQEAERALLHAS